MGRSWRVCQGPAQPSILTPVPDVGASSVSHLSCRARRKFSTASKNALALWRNGHACPPTIRRRAAVHPHMDVFAPDGYVLGDRGEDLLPQNAEQIGLSARRPLVRQQDLEPLPRYWSGAPAPERVEEAHAALRPNSLSNKPLRSVGMLIGTISPLSLRAASR